MAGGFWIESDYNWKDHCSSANLLTLYGILDQVVSDNGPQFVAEDFAVFMKSNGVKHLCCSLYYPASKWGGWKVCQDLPGYQVKSTAGSLDKQPKQPKHVLTNCMLDLRIGSVLAVVL